MGYDGSVPAKARKRILGFLAPGVRQGGWKGWKDDGKIEAWAVRVLPWWTKFLLTDPSQGANAMKKVLFLALVIPAFLGLVAYEARQVGAACTIGFDVNQPDCDNTNSSTDRGFTFPLAAACTHDGVNNWTLRYAFTPGNSFNVTHTSITPLTHLVDQTDNYPSTFVGSLNALQTCGNYQVSAWDADFVLCSASHDVTIRVFGATCTPGC
jgi:hypothetical protein